MQDTGRGSAGGRVDGGRKRREKWGLNEPGSEIKRAPKGEAREERPRNERGSESERETTMFEVGA